MENSQERKEAMREALSQIDVDHRVLFEVIDTVLELVNEGPVSTPSDTHLARLKRQIGRLEREAKTHVARESGYMREYEYAGVESHNELHNDFSAAVAGLRAAVEAEGLSPNVRERAVSVGEWLRSHLTEDEDFLNYLGNCAQTPAT